MKAPYLHESPPESRLKSLPQPRSSFTSLAYASHFVDSHNCRQQGIRHRRGLGSDGHRLGGSFGPVVPACQGTTGSSYPKRDARLQGDGEGNARSHTGPAMARIHVIKSLGKAKDHRTETEAGPVGAVNGWAMLLPPRNSRMKWLYIAAILPYLWLPNQIAPGAKAIWQLTPAGMLSGPAPSLRRQSLPSTK